MNSSVNKLGLNGLQLVLLLGISVNARHAMAQESAEAPTISVDGWDSRRFSLAGQVGFASPGGLIGIETEYALQHWLVLGAGIGPTIMGDSKMGGQAGAWLAPRWAFTNVALGIDLGASAGPYRAQAFLDEHGPWASYDTAGWFNTAARFQYLHERGFLLRAFVGVATLLNPADGRCGVGWDSKPCSGRSLGYGGLAFGYAFKTD